MDKKINLLLFNLKVDADDSILGFTTDWINALAQKCNKIVVITMYQGRLALANNVQVYSAGKEKEYSKLRRLFEFYRLLFKLLDNEKIDVCFAHMIPIFTILAYPVLKLKKIPILLWYAHSHVSFILKIATKLVDKVISSNKQGFQIDTPKLSIIGQGIDTNKFTSNYSKKNKQKITLLTVGRISPIKKLEIILQALQYLTQDSLNQLRLVYVGSPDGKKDEIYQNKLKMIIAQNNLSNMVEFKPAMPFYQIQSVYQNADIFINNSDGESMDKAVLEAMSSGLFVIVNSKAFQDVLSKELLDLCFIPKNNPKQLAHKIEYFLQLSTEEKKTITNQLRNIVINNHSLEQLTNKVFNHLNQLIL